MTDITTQLAEALRIALVLIGEWHDEFPDSVGTNEDQMLRIATEALAAYAAAQSAPSERAQGEREAFGAWFRGFRHGWKSEKDVAFDAWQARAALAQRPDSAPAADWERELSAVMPQDFKDWWQNDRHEWPAVAAAVIRSQRADCELGWKMAAEAAPEAPTLTHELQQQCSDWGVYWRASDAHGVDLSIEQAEELLRRALGVEVAISKAAPQAQAAGQDERAAFGAWFQGYRHGWKSEKDVTFDAWQARAALAQRQPLTLDAFDEHDLCDSFAGLPVEWFNPGPSFGATTGEQHAG